MGGVLEGVRVLDFGRYIAGPYCATLLAEFGAEVIRVEKRDGSEDRFVAPVGEGGEGALFLQINRNKMCITLDPMTPEGQEVMRRLIATSDVVVANLPPQTLRAMKLDYDSLKAIKPDIILTTATAFGGPGPWSDRVGFDGVGQVMSGSVYMTGAGDPPYRAAVNWVDFGTALHCAFGTLAALIERGKSGRGQIVEGALLATALSFTNATLIEQAVINVNRVPTGNLGQTAAPAEREIEARAPGRIAVMHQFAHDVVDRRDVVGIHGVAQAEHPGKPRRRHDGGPVGKHRKGPGPGRNVGDNEPAEQQDGAWSNRPHSPIDHTPNSVHRHLLV